jgi:hypothetical protein
MDSAVLTRTGAEPDVIALFPPKMAAVLAKCTLLALCLYFVCWKWRCVGGIAALHPSARFCSHFQ